MRIRHSFLALLALALGAQALTLPSFGSGQARVPEAASLDTALAQTWEGIKARNITAFGNGLVHRPKSEYPGDAVSEGQGYGMLVAVLMNDQTTFDKIWDATESSMLNVSGTKSSYNWWRCQDGGTACNGPTYKDGPASDADQDIALSLLFADSLVKKGKWKSHISPKGASYGQRAQRMLNAIWSDMIDQGRYFKPGSWGGASVLNPGYFSPAWYRIFAARDSVISHDWKAVVEQSYQTILAGPGAGMGLVCDWSNGQGQPLSAGPGYNAFANGQWFYKDAVRVLWRLALDYAWFGDVRAKRFLDSAAAFIKAPANADFFQISGKAIPKDSLFVFNGGKTSRPRAEHSHLTVAMWGCLAVAQDAQSVSDWSSELLKFHESDADYWGLANDAAGEDTLHNELYFDQFLAWFGGATLAGRFVNIPEELADPDPSTPMAWKVGPSITPMSLDFQKDVLTGTGTLSKAGAWRVTITHRDSGTVWSSSGSSADLSIRWNGQSSDGKSFPQGWCNVVFSVKGLQDVKLFAWVSHQRDLRANADWLVIDSCKETVISPNLGAWKGFTNTDKGGSSSVALALEGTGADRGLVSRYDLGTGGYQYGGLQWNAQGWTGFAAATKIRFKAKADHSTVVDFYVVQSNIGDDSYLHVLDTIGTGWKTYEHTFSQFTPRLGGGNTLDMSKATALNWHIQADKCLNSASCLTGNVTIADVVMAGDMAKMYAAPGAAKAKPDTTPEPVIGIHARAGLVPMVRLTGSQLRVNADEATVLILRDLSGRVLEKRELSSGSHVLDLRSSGMVVMELRGPTLHETRLLRPVH